MNEDELRAFIRPIRREVWGWRVLYVLTLWACYCAL